jgi:hypothetical protein
MSSETSSKPSSPREGLKKSVADLQKSVLDLQECYLYCVNAMLNIMSIPSSYMTVKDAMAELERDRKHMDELKDYVRGLSAELKKYVRILKNKSSESKSTENENTENKKLSLDHLILPLCTMYDETMSWLKLHESRGNGDKKCKDLYITSLSYIVEPASDGFVV